MTTKMAWPLFLLLLAFVTLSCMFDYGADSGTIEAVPFSDRFTLSGHVSPQQDKVHLVARVADVDVDKTGLLYVVDSSEGNVKIYAQSGALRAVLGRKGRGPGEFVQPWRVELGPDGTIHVLDLSLNRITIFGSMDDQTPRIIHLEGVNGVQDFALLQNGHYGLIDRWGPKPGVLVLVTEEGEEYARYLEEARTRTPNNEPDGPAWDYPRVLFARAQADTVFVTSSLVNELWAVSVKSGQITKSTVDFPAYKAPVLPDRSDPVFSKATGMIEWFSNFHLNGYAVPYAEGFLWPFVQGDYWTGGPRILLHHDARVGQWEVLNDAPVIAAANADVIVGLRDAATDDMDFLIFTRRD